MMTTTTSRPTDASLLTKRLRDEIVGGHVPPGARLKLAHLAEQYDVSRGPLREAASRLAAEGLISIEDQRGFRVAPVSREDLLDLTSTRQRIELLALGDAIEHGDLAWEGRVTAANHVLERTGAGTDANARAQFRDAHRAFHEALVSGCPSRYLLRYRERLYALAERYRNLAAAQYRSGRARDVQAEHAAIVDAALSRDADKACRLMQDHLDATAQTLIDAYPELAVDDA